MRTWAVLVQVSFVALTWAACSSNPSTTDGGTDAALDVTSDKCSKCVPDVAQQDQGNGSCGPTSVDPSTVTWTAPRAINPYGCSAQQIQDFDTICIQGTNQAACTAWTTANASCNTCLQSNEGDPTFGPLINTTVSGYTYVNTGGCIALLTGDASATGCGAKEWESSECEDDACSACSSTSTPDYNTCATQADTATCTQFFNARCDLTDAGAATPCDLNAGTFDELLIAVSTVMCGGYAADAGPPDAGTD